MLLLSSDEDQQSFEEYYGEMLWLTVDHQAEEVRDKLNEKFGANSIPQLTLLDGDSGEILSQDARGQVQSKDKDGKNFPWKEDEKKE